MILTCYVTVIAFWYAFREERILSVYYTLCASFSLLREKRFPSLSCKQYIMVHTYIRNTKDVKFELGAVTVDPGSDSFDPSPLIPYMKQLGIEYLYERQGRGATDQYYR